MPETTYVSQTTEPCPTDVPPHCGHHGWPLAWVAVPPDGTPGWRAECCFPDEFRPMGTILNKPAPGGALGVLIEMAERYFHPASAPDVAQQIIDSLESAGYEISRKEAALPPVGATVRIDDIYGQVVHVGPRGTVFVLPPNWPGRPLRFDADEIEEILP